jgi:Protein of unknown function (DUF4242)
MTLIVVERAFEAPREYSELQAREQSAAFCLDTYRVKSLQSFLAFDRRHMLCLYEAPDAEAVRATQRTAELPVAHIWPAQVIVEHSTPVPPGYSLVVAQRAMPPGITLELIQQGLAASKGCNDRLRLEHHAAYRSLDGSRMCCIYYSPDVESVRVTSRENGVPLERAWSAERFVCAG